MLFLMPLGAHPSLPHELASGATSMTLAEHMNPDVNSVLVSGNHENSGQANSKPAPYREEQTCEKVCFITGQSHHRDSSARFPYHRSLQGQGTY